MTVPLYFNVQHGGATPIRASVGAAGLDLFSQTIEVLDPGDLALVPTGVRVELPAGTVGLLSIRSHLAVEHGLILANGVGIIDSDYRGEICAAIYNVSRHRCKIDVGQRIVQLTVVRLADVDVFYKDESELSPTDRGEGGFGSTGR